MCDVSSSLVFVVVSCCFFSTLYFLRIFRYLKFSFDKDNQRYLELTFLLVRMLLWISLITILTSENTILTRGNVIMAIWSAITDRSVVRLNVKTACHSPLPCSFLVTYLGHQCFWSPVCFLGVFAQRCLCLLHVQISSSVSPSSSPAPSTSCLLRPCSPVRPLNAAARLLLLSSSLVSPFYC